MTTIERIEKKKSTLMEIFSELPENQLIIAVDLIDQAAFMAVTLEDLAEKIAANGTTEEYSNGANQKGRKISSDAKLYSSLITKYSAIVIKLMKIVPDNGAPDYNEVDRLEPWRKKIKMREAFLEAVKNGEVKPYESGEFYRQWEERNQ